MNIRRVRNIKNCIIKKDDAVLLIGEDIEEYQSKSVSNLSLSFESIEYDSELLDEDKGRCFSLDDANKLADFLDVITNRSTLWIVCEDNSIYWSLSVILYSTKGYQPTECVYLTVKELPNVVPLAWMIYLYEACINGTGGITEEVDNYCVTKKAFDKFGNCAFGSW